MYQEKIGLVHYEINELEKIESCGADKEAILQLECSLGGQGEQNKLLGFYSRKPFVLFFVAVLDAKDRNHSAHTLRKWRPSIRKFLMPVHVDAWSWDT